jgi:hypothetical protein
MIMHPKKTKHANRGRSRTGKKVISGIEIVGKRETERQREKESERRRRKSSSERAAIRERQALPQHHIGARSGGSSGRHGLRRALRSRRRRREVGAAALISERDRARAGGRAPTL